MKQVQPYLPAILIGAAALAAVYFLYFRPKQQEKDAANAAAQSTADAANYNQLINYQPGTESFNPNWATVNMSGRTAATRVNATISNVLHHV